jgi:hypothetical protein
VIARIRFTVLSQEFQPAGDSGAGDSVKDDLFQGITENKHPPKGPFN